MCGISGIYTQQINENHLQIIDDVLQSQFARGPDYQAREIMQMDQCGMVFGHNRLSIIDLSEQSNQPMVDASGRYCITYNGEIYNYIELRNELKLAGFQFKTQGDTEVILQAFACWGIAALDRFYGPFAFAIFDRETQKLFLCRDRFGVRPLYYVQKNNTLYFASTVAVLAKKLGLKPNLTYIANGLNYFVYENESAITPYQDMLSVPAGYYLTAKFANDILTSEIQQYYNLTDRALNLAEQLANKNTEDLLAMTAETFNQAVTIRLRSDVPLGITLSSGLDSTSVAALVSNQHANTIGFSYGEPANKNTEGFLAAQSAKFLGINIKYVWPKLDEMIDGLWQTIDAQQAPFSSLSVVAQYLLYKQIKAAGIKVILGGQGGDEAFMGYRKFIIFGLQQKLHQKNYLALAKNLIQIFPMLLSEFSAFGAYWRQRKRYTGQVGLQNIIQLPGVPALNLNNARDQALNLRQIQDITQFSLPTLLRYEDRNAMSHGVESRLPFLDHRLVELGVALPETLKLHAGFGKWPIRKIMADKIPNNIRLARYKRGFDIPLAELLNSGLGKSIRAALQSNFSVIKEFLMKGASINQLFSDQQLLSRPNAITEAITLLWLNKVTL